jgi:hypothetical protein
MQFQQATNDLEIATIHNTRPAARQQSVAVSPRNLHRWHATAATVTSPSNEPSTEYFTFWEMFLLMPVNWKTREEFPETKLTINPLNSKITPNYTYSLSSYRAVNIFHLGY